MKVPIPLERVDAILTDALDSGSTHWVGTIVKINPTAWNYLDKGIRPLLGCYWPIEYALNEGGELIIHHPNGVGHLHLVSIEQGLNAMAEKYPERYLEIFDGNNDADTADTLLQCCICGEVIYFG